MLRLEQKFRRRRVWGLSASESFDSTTAELLARQGPRLDLVARGNPKLVAEGAWRSSGGALWPSQAGGTKVGRFDGYVVSIADIIGDWREEIITSTTAGEVRIYTTTIPAVDRRVTLTQDPVYRNDLVHQAMGYSYRGSAMTSTFAPACARMWLL